MADLQRLLTPVEAADLIRYKPGTLAIWRSEGRGPVYIKIGHSVRYRQEDLEKWILAGPSRRREIEDAAECHRLQSSKTKRPRGRVGSKLRAKRLAAEPLCRDCAEAGVERSSEEIDHIIPLSFGGSDDDDNVRALCRNCHWMRTRQNNRQYGPPPRKLESGY